MIIIQLVMAIGQCRHKLPHQLRLVKRSGVAKNVPSPIVEKRTKSSLWLSQGLGVYSMLCEWHLEVSCAQTLEQHKLGRRNEKFMRSRERGKRPENEERG